MSEWWTYRPSDFLMFAPRTYWRLFELHNEAWWPAQALVSVLTALLLVGLWRRHGPTLRLGVFAVAVAWVFVAWAFLWQRYAPINWAASGFAWGFVVQGLGLLALSSRSAVDATPSRERRAGGLALLLWALVAHPALGLLFGRPWAQAEVIGLAPDPTAIATLGLLLCVSGGPRALQGVLVAGALAWLTVSAATLATMGSAQAAVPVAAALLAGAALWRARSPQ